MPDNTTIADMRRAWLLDDASASMFERMQAAELRERARLRPDEFPKGTRVRVNAVGLKSLRRGLPKQSKAGEVTGRSRYPGAVLVRWDGNSWPQPISTAFLEREPLSAGHAPAARQLEGGGA